MQLLDITVSSFRFEVNRSDRAVIKLDVAAVINEGHKQI